MTEEIIERLRSLDLSDGGSHLSAIASCFYQPTFGWTGGSCEILRDLLIEILEGKDGNDDNNNSDGCSRAHHRCDQHGRQVSYDELDNERHKAVCELRNMQMDTGNAIKKLAVALGLEWNPNNSPKSVALLQSRIIHLLGGDECNFSGVESYMDAMGGKSNPAETSDESTDHVTLATPSSEDETCPNPVRDASIIDKLDNERHKAIAELRKVCTKLDESVWTWIEDVAIAIGAQDKQSDKYESMLPEITDRLIHLLGGDQPMLSDLYGIWQDGAESENKGSESAHKMTKSAEIAKPESEDGGKVTITDELRKFKGLINTGLTPEMAIALRVEINRIADRIDEQFDRSCEQQEKVLQDTIDYMCEEQGRLQERLRTAELGCDANHRLAKANARWCDELVDLLRDAAKEYKTLDQALAETSANFHAMRDRVWSLEAERDELQSTIDEMAAELESARAKNRQLVIHIGQMQGGSKKWREKCEALTAERDELQAKLDDYDKTHVELPKDENDEYIHVEDVMDGYGKTIEVVELRYGRSGWMLISRDGNGYADTFAFAHHHEPTVEQVIRDLTLGKITESQAIERIEDING